jgi:hypothetical protein
MTIAARWIAFLSVAWIALLPLASVAAAQEDVLQRIRRLPSTGRAQSLGADLLAESRAPAAAAAAAWRTGDPAVRRNARTVLNEMEEAALDPLLKADGELDPDEQVWRMTMVVETIGDLRRSAAAMLHRQLANKQPAPLPSMPGAEERDPSRRVCDEAYLLMSRLTATDPHGEAFLLRMRRFSRMPVPARNAEIQRARNSAAWRGILNRQPAADR